MFSRANNIQQMSRPTILFALPVELLVELTSWCPEASDAAALMNTCTVLHRHRADPAAAALLLLRCRCTSYTAALMSFGTSSSDTVDLVQQLLYLLQAASSAGGPYSAAVELLDAMMLWASRTGSLSTITALLALPKPPDVNNYQCLRRAVEGPHISVLNALLAAGASPCPLGSLILFFGAAAAPERLAALQLLLSYCPEEELARARRFALWAAIGPDNCATVAEMLLAYQALKVKPHLNVPQLALTQGSLNVVQWTLVHCPPTQDLLNNYLEQSVKCARSTCVASKLRARILDETLQEPIEMVDVAHGEGTPLARMEIMRMLLRLGASVSPGVIKLAETVAQSDVLALLREWES